jgi:hypothetical protein
MTSRPLAAIVGTAFALGLIVHVDRAPTQPVTTQHGLLLSAAAKKSGQARQRGVPGQIACTITGCHPIPPHCHPETGYNWDGIPTGFDIVVCRPPRGRGG